MHTTPLTDWIKSELYPTLYDYLPQVLPELQLTRKGNNWQSALNIDGTQPKNKRRDKTVIHYKNPGYLHENGEGGSVTIVDYVARREGVEFIQAVQLLAQAVNMAVPKSEDSSQDWQQGKARATLLEDAQAYYKYCIDSDSQQAAQVRQYLHQRGYTQEQYRAMELGYIPSQEQLYAYLASRGHDPAQARTLIPLEAWIGSTNKLTIPYYSAGQLHGHTYRTIDETAKAPKYVNQTGLAKGELLFNLKPERSLKEVVLVEGYLDALAAEAYGLQNVAALAGTTITTGQIDQAKRKGITQYSICLDTDQAGQSKVKDNIEALLQAGVYNVYIVNLPDTGGGKSDLDSILREQGLQAAKMAIDQAQPYYSYLLHQIINRYSGQELTGKQVNDLLQEVIQQGARIPHPIHRDQYRLEFMVMEGVKELGITQESYEIVAQELTTTAAKERQNKELAETLQQAVQLTRKGSTQEALDLLTKKTPQLQGTNREQEYSKLLLPASLESDRQELQGLPQDLQTSYTVTTPSHTTRQEYPILLPGGGLTVVAGQTGHGKTTLLINLALDITNRHPDRRIVYITYEEQETIIRSYFLNTYIGQQLNNATSQAKGNKAVIKEYLRTGQTQYVGRKELLETKAAEFYSTYITSGRLQVKELDYPIRDLAAAIRYLHQADKSIAGIFIDYFQLLHADAIHKRETGANNRQEELKQICIMLKDVATQTGLPLILGAQFNRQVDSVIDLDYKAIGEAGDIERIANTILGIYDIRYERRSSDSRAAAKAVADRIGERETGLYLEVLKSRYMPRGGHAIYEYDSNTGVINPIPAQW